MRKIRVLVVLAVLAAASSMPMVAQAQVALPSWGGGSVVEGLFDWMGGLWSALAGSESGPAAGGDSGNTNGVAPDGPAMAITADDPTTQTEVFPEFDPDG